MADYYKANRMGLYVIYFPKESVNKCGWDKGRYNEVMDVYLSDRTWLVELGLFENPDL